MPVYEFKCEDCGRQFDLVASLAEFDAGLKPTCPKCAGRKCRQLIGRVTLLTSSKSDDDFGDLGDDGAEDFSDSEDDGGSDSFGNEEDGLDLDS